MAAALTDRRIKKRAMLRQIIDSCLNILTEKKEALDQIDYRLLDGIVNKINTLSNSKQMRRRTDKQNKMLSPNDSHAEEDDF